jgi:CDP-diacylglycerol--serine O-phosphatidyltransferase
VKFLGAKQRKKARKPIPFKQVIPNMVTSGNLLCGMFSLMLTFNGRFVPAAWMVFFAVVFDGLDGKVARSLGGGTHFGLEYDSLADVVSFGVAPSMMVYAASLKGFGGITGAMIAGFFALCVALRLARFNVAHVPGPFQGLPSPAGGLFVASFAMAGLPMESMPAVMAAVLLITGFLMVSSVPYANLKKLTKTSANKKKCYLLLGAVSLSFVLLHGTAPLLFFSVYILSGLLRFDWEKWLLLHTEEGAAGGA